MQVDTGAQLIVEDILKDANEKAASIIRAAKKEAQAILDSCSLDLKKEEENELKKAHAQGKSIYEELLSEGRMKARRMLLQKREEFIDEVLKEAEKELEDYTSTEKYEKDLIRITMNACKKLGSAQVVIRTNRRDLKLIEKFRGQILKELGGNEKAASVSIGEPIQAIGGVRVLASDGKVEIDETLDGKLQREIESLRVKVAKVLFEGSK